MCKCSAVVNAFAHLGVRMTGRDIFSKKSAAPKPPWGSIDRLPSGKYRLRGQINGEMATVGSFETLGEALGTAEHMLQCLVASALDEKEAERSWVYFIADDAGFFKVGFAKDIALRIRDLQIGTPHELTLFARTPGGPIAERTAHAALRNFHKRGEWFRDCPESRAIVSVFVEGRRLRALAKSTPPHRREGDR